ncbi:MAG: hypothetical protein ACTJLM_00245 [Ehrlichia sp.]
MEGSEGGGINVSALQSYLHQQHKGGEHGAEDEETALSIFVFLAWFYRNVPCFLDTTTGNVVASVTALGLNMPTTVTFGSELSKNIFGLPKLIPDLQEGGGGDEPSDTGEGAAGGGEGDEGIHANHNEDPYARDDYPHADEHIASAAGHGLDGTQHDPGYHSEYQEHAPSPTPATTPQHGQYDHDFH